MHVSRLLTLTGAALVTFLLLCCPLSAADPSSPSGDRIDFERDIAPILAARCYSCHGPDEQEGQLRLDARAIVFQGGISGPLLVKGNAGESLLYRRIAGLGDEDQMPLDDDPLSDAQQELIRRWIDQGASWPKDIGADATAIQPHWAYVAPRRPRLPAVRDTAWPQNAIDSFILARLEAEGLSPSPRADRARLMRRVHLDLIGIPPSVEQVDLFLADSSPDAYSHLVDRLLSSPRYGERWARPWLDLARYADSNGYQADQYRNVWPYRDWVIHACNADMPFDQFTIEQLAGDLLPDATVENRIATGFHRLTTCNVEAGVDPEENRAEQIFDRVNTTGTVWLGTTIECSQCHNHKYDPFTQRDYYQLFAYFNNTPLEVEGNGVTYNFTGPKMVLPLPDRQQQRRQQLQAEYDQLKKTLDIRIDEARKQQPEWEQQLARAGQVQDDPDAEPLPEAIAKILETPAEQRGQKQRKQLEEHFLQLQDDIKQLRGEVAKCKTQLDAIQPETTLVMIEMGKPRSNFVFRRGNFLDHAQPVRAGTPAALHAGSADLPGNRLGLARWLVDPDNPLLGRVTVNRWWAEFFGQGIVSTLEDFGSQGEGPTHPELLDWLAVEFVESGYSMKHVHRLIVTSAAYQQSSRFTAELRRRDPYNRLYARGARVRLSAEAIRDHALTASGLLSTKMRGPPVYPPQPEGVWRHVGRNAPKYTTSSGTDRFRRGIYVIWRRSAPYASFVNFDAPDRSSCVIQRPRTNTPLQALTLLNDPAYVEIGMALADRMMRDDPSMSIPQRVTYGFRRVLARRPTAVESRQLEEVFRQTFQRLQQDPSSARALVGKRRLASDSDAAELAAWFYVANILLNLDETITKG